MTRAEFSLANATETGQEENCMKLDAKRLTNLAILLTIPLYGCQNAGQSPTVMTPEREPGTTTGRQENATGEAPQRQGAAQTVSMIRVTDLTESVSPGQMITLRIQTMPSVPVRIETDGAGPDQMNNLRELRTDSQGSALWQWQLDPQYKADKVPVIITADLNDKDMKAIQSVNVKQNGEQASAIKADIISQESSARRGQDVTIAIMAEPGVTADLEAQGLAQVSAMPPRTADESGRVEWTFKVDENYAADKVPIVITVSKGDSEKKLISSIALSPQSVGATGKNL